MGNNCCQKQTGNNSSIYSTKALMNQNNFNGMDFYFSTENLSRLEGQCLVVFSDRKLKIKRTNLSKIVTEKEKRKIQEYVAAYLQDNTISFEKIYQQKSRQSRQHHSQMSTKDPVDLEYILIDFDIPTIKFRKLLIIFVEPWQGKTSIKRMMEQRIVRALQQVQKLKIKQIAFIQFNEQLGIPTNVGAAIMARAIFIMSEVFKIATICCQNISDQISYLAFFQNFKEDQTLTSYSKKSIKDSNYY